MTMVPTTVLAAAATGDTLGLALVSRGPRGGRVIATSTVEAYASGGAERAAAAARELVGGRRVREAVVVAPAAWCLTREIAVSPRDWPSARAGVLDSLEDLLPMRAEDARVGLLGLLGEGERLDRGAVIAARREDVDPLVAAIESAAPGARVATISSHMAALGLGLQGETTSSVVEHDGAAEASVELERGLARSVDGTSPRGARIVRVGTDVRAAELAAAGAAALRAAPAAIAPLTGPAPRAWARSAAPALVGAAAAVMLAAAPFVWSARLESGAERARAQRASLSEQLESARDARARAEELTALCAAYDNATAGWGGVTPALREALAALGGEGFLYRAQLDAGTLTITGESPDPGAVLERLESSSRFRGARFMTPLTSSPTDESLRVFNIRASAADAGGEEGS